MSTKQGHVLNYTDYCSEGMRLPWFFKLMKICGRPSHVR